jgi:hypothetical protein
MKTNRNIWRIVTLALALVMLFSVVACSNEEEAPVASTDGTTTAAPTTKKPTTTEKPTTQKPTTQTQATTEPTTEPTTELPAYSVVVPSNFDANNDGVNDSYLFSNKLPAAFLAEGVVKVHAGDYDQTLSKGVGSAERISGSGIRHYYVNLDEKENIPDDEQNMTYTFEIAEAGVYEILLDLGMKDSAQQRGAVYYIDGGEGIAMDYTVTAEFAAAVRDETQGTYVTGLSVELTKGTHTLVVKYNPLCSKTIHFRNFYFAKSTKTSIDKACNYDNDGDGKNDVYTFTNYMPMEYGDANAIIVKGDSFDQEVSKGWSKAERISGSGVYHYYINLDEKENIPDEEQNLTYKFTVAEAGKYKVCFGLGMKDSKQQRGATIYFDGATDPIHVDYDVDAAFAAAVRDETQGSYMTGMVVELGAGEHTMVIKYEPLCSKTMHFRNFYFIKMAEETPAA